MQELITKEHRLTYMYVNNPRNDFNGNPKYSLAIIIQKDDKETLDEYEAVLKKEYPQLDFYSMLKDSADIETLEGDDFYLLTVKGKFAPDVVDRKNNPITNPEQIYSGMWGRVLISAKYYHHAETKRQGVTLYLQGIMKTADDNALVESVRDKFAKII